MKFDIARKIVKFQNGQFGVRRWSIFGYQFLDLSDDPDMFWWGINPEYIAKYSAGTEERARARLAQYLNPPVTPATPGYDKGRPA